MPQEDLFSSEPQPGSIVQGKYALLRKLSEGGGGVVWAAVDPQGREVALKFLKWSPVKSRTSVAERFKNEFAILKSLAHPNIAQIHDFGLDQPSGLYFFTSELLTEGDFRTMIRAEIPALEELLLQSLRALEYLRGNRLLHLDIKPHNLLLRQRGDHPLMALIDFGLATFRPPDRPGGTPNYMAPELIAMRFDDLRQFHFGPPDHRTDLYSLGVTFYHCLTGVQPFAVNGPEGRIDPEATLKRHLDHTPPPPSAHRPEIPAYLDRIVMKLMAMHPDDRYPSAIVAAQALQYSSPRPHEPECVETLLSYLPREGRLIAREEQLSTIESSLSAVAQGIPHALPAIVVSGGRGTGRTRLLRAAKPVAQQLEMDATLFSEGDPITSAAIETILSEEQARGAAAHAILIDDLDLMLRTDPREDDAALRAAFLALVRRLKIQQRLPDPPRPRLFLLFTASTDRCDPVELLTDLNLPGSICPSIPLQHFTSRHLGDYLAALLGERPDAAIIEELMRCTGGNPLFLTEHLEQMISQGRLFSLAGRPDAATIRAIGIDFAQVPPPRSLAEMVRGQLTSFTPEVRRLALALACWSRPASVEELKAASGLEAISAEILALTTARLVRRSRKDGRICFANTLAARIITESSKRGEVEACHDAIARHLRQLRSRDAAELELHIAYGSDNEKRAPALLRTASRALEQSQPMEAAHHLEELFAIAPASDWRVRAEALELLGKACEKSHRDADARAAYQRLKRLTAPQSERPRLRAEAAESLGLLSMRHRDLRDARRHFDEALGFVDGSRPLTAQRLRIENDLASVILREGRVEEARDRFERSAAVAERALSREERALVTNNELGDALLRLGDAGRAIEILRQELQIAIRSKDPERIANRHYLLANAMRHDAKPRLEEARHHYDEGLSIAREHRLVELQVRLLNGLGNLLLKSGEAEKAMSCYREGLKLAQQVEGETTSVEIMIGMGLAAQKLSQPDGVIEYFEAALDFARAPKGASAGLIRRYRPAMYVSLGDAYFQKHDLPHAEEYLRKAMAMDRKQPLTPDLRYSLFGTYVEIFLERGEEAAARRHMPTLEAIIKSFPPAKEHFAKLAARLNS